MSSSDLVLGLTGDLDRIAEGLDARKPDRDRAEQLERQLDQERERAERAENAVRLLQQERSAIRRTLKDIASAEEAP